MPDKVLSFSPSLSRLLATAIKRHTDIAGVSTPSLALLATTAREHRYFQAVSTPKSIFKVETLKPENVFVMNYHVIE